MTTSSKTLSVAVLTLAQCFHASSAFAQPKAETAEQQLFQAINRERAANGLPPLKWDDALANAARQHAERWRRRKRFRIGFPGEPSLPSRATRAGARFSWLSENVAAGTERGEYQRAVDAVSQPPRQPSGCRHGHDRRRSRRAQRSVFAVADFSKAKH